MSDNNDIVKGKKSQFCIPMDENIETKPAPPPPTVKSPPSTKRNSKIPSIKSPTETIKEEEKWIDYREFALMLDNN